MPISSEELAKLARETDNLGECIEQIPPDSRVNIISSTLLSLINNSDHTASTNIIKSFDLLDKDTQDKIFDRVLKTVDKQNNEDAIFKQSVANVVALTLVKAYHSPEQFPANFIQAAFGALEVEYLLKCLESLNKSSTQFSKPVEGFIVGVLVKVYDSSSSFPDAVRIQAFNEVFKRIPNYMPEFALKPFQNTSSFLPDATWIFGKAGECFEAVLNGKDIGSVTKSFLCKYVSKITGAVTSSKYMEESPPNSMIAKPIIQKASSQPEPMIAKL